MESLRMVFLRIIWKDINTHNITKLTTQLAIVVSRTLSEFMIDYKHKWKVSWFFNPFPYRISRPFQSE